MLQQIWAGIKECLDLMPTVNNVFAKSKNFSKRLPFLIHGLRIEGKKKSTNNFWSVTKGKQIVRCIK